MTRYVNYTVSADGISPDTLMWGGVQHENNGVKVRYQIEEEYLKTLKDAKFRIDFSSVAAGYDPSEFLYPDEDNCISRAIGEKFTRFGGKMQSTLVIVKDDAEVKKIPAELFFTSSLKEEEPMIDNLSAYEKHMLSLVQEANEYVFIAQGLLDEVKNTVKTASLEHDNFVKKTEFADNLGNPGILRLNSSYGISSGRYDSQSPITGDTVIIQTPSNGIIKQRTNKFMPITPSNIDYAVKCALAYSKLDWTENEINNFKKLFGIDNSITVVEKFSINSADDWGILPQTEDLIEGETYKWHLFSPEEMGWIKENSTVSSQKHVITSVARKITVDEKEYVGFNIQFTSTNGIQTCNMWIYQDGEHIKFKRDFYGSADIAIFR